MGGVPGSIQWMNHEYFECQSRMQGNLEFGFELEPWFVMISSVGLPPDPLHHTHGHHPNQYLVTFSWKERQITQNWDSILLSSSVQSLSCVWLFATPWTAARQASLSITNSQSLLRLTSIMLVMPPNHLIFCHLLLLLPSIFPSIRVFSNKSVLHIRWPKYWSFSVSISPSDEYSGLITFRMDWFDLFAVQRTLKSLLQQESSPTQFKSINFLCSAFFIVQLSHPYILLEKS